MAKWKVDDALPTVAYALALEKRGRLVVKWKVDDDLPAVAFALTLAKIGRWLCCKMEG